MGKACRLRSIHRGSLNISGVSADEDGSPGATGEAELVDWGGRIRKGATRTNGHYGRTRCRSIVNPASAVSSCHVVQNRKATLTCIYGRNGNSQRKGDQEKRPFDAPNGGDPGKDVGQDAEGCRGDGHGQAPVGQESVEA